MNGKFIVIEGIDGAGKTSAVTQIADILYNNGINNLIFTHEPGGTPLANALCALLKDDKNNEPITNHTELLMLYAARSQLVENVIKPALASGTWVIGDRHALSSKAYQGGGRNMDEDLLNTLHNIILGNFCPNLTFYLNIPPTLGITRIQTRSKLDRIEKEPLEFFYRTSKRYQALISKDEHVITIDATQPQSTVNHMIQIRLTEWLYTQMLI